MADSVSSDDYGSPLPVPKCPLLPAELWQDIMGYLPKSDLKALSTAHCLIRFHAIPLLYRRVTIYTGRARADEKAKGLVEARYILRWINALVFSAPFDSSFLDAKIFNNFVTSFSEMPNLRELKLERIFLDSRAETEILDAPLLSFACERCVFTSEQSTSALARNSTVTTLQLTLLEDNALPNPPSAFLNNFLNLETLDITAPYRAYSRVPKFPSITSLIIRGSISLDTFCTMLRQSPHLERLRCADGHHKDNGRARIILCLLQHIEAPSSTVIRFIQLLESPVLESIVILARSRDHHNQCESINRLLLAIKEGPGRQMTSLDMTIRFHSQEEAREFMVNLSDAVPNLGRFTMRIDPFSSTTILANPLYNGNARLPKLESLSVSAVLHWTQPQVFPEAMVEPFARGFLEPLVRPICPSLKVVRVFPWCGSLDKTALEGEGTMWKFERRY